MTYQAEVYFSPANELISSFFTYLCKKSHKRLDLGVEWAKEVKSSLTPAFANRLDELEYWNDWAQLQLVAWQCPHQGAADFLQWFFALSAGEIYELFSPWIKHFPEDLAKMRDCYGELLSAWEEQYFRHVKPSRLESLQQDAEEKQLLQSEYGTRTAEYVDRVTNGLMFEPTERLEKILLIPQLHWQPANIIHAFDGLTVCQYASDHCSKAEADDPTPALYRMTRSLGDKNRLKILHFLKDGPKCYTDVVRYIGLAKSTTYEHVLNLRSAGVIRGHVVGCSIHSYSLRKEAIDLLRDQLLEYLS